MNSAHMDAFSVKDTDLTKCSGINDWTPEMLFFVSKSSYKHILLLMSSTSFLLSTNICVLVVAFCSFCWTKNTTVKALLLVDCRTLVETCMFVAVLTNKQPFLVTGH